MSIQENVRLTMKQTVERVQDGKVMIFTRQSEEEARELFDKGVTISVMTADRNPANSLTTEIDYTKGEELFWNASNDIACNFDQVKDDFAEWQENDGYGHCPDHEAAENYDFSYWTCEIKNTLS